MTAHGAVRSQHPPTEVGRMIAVLGLDMQRQNPLMPLCSPPAFGNWCHGWAQPSVSVSSWLCIGSQGCYVAPRSLRHVERDRADEGRRVRAFAPEVGVSSSIQ
mmetsp:Transcript_82379/g.207844  ORF Transcript_82379/g.207844 Transcript_82379/m.207844 type:complete len:103 (+) Transcript_82379:1050-1358(+)